MIRTVFFLFMFIFSCTISENINESLQPVTVNIPPVFLTGTGFFHYYLYSSDSNKRHHGVILQPGHSAELKIYPGIYHIACYYFEKKTSESWKPVYFQYIDQVKIAGFYQLKPEFHLLYPDYQINNNRLSINLTPYFSLFSVSALSIKQNQDRVRSLDFYIDELFFLKSEITYYEKGPWYLNISYSLKSRYDKELLDESGYTISTQYISNIYLGDY